jgi:hypothetical protein
MFTLNPPATPGLTISTPPGKTKSSKRNVPLTARVKGVHERRHEEAGKPQFGFVFSQDDKEKSAVPYISGSIHSMIEHWRSFRSNSGFMTAPTASKRV